MSALIAILLSVVPQSGEMDRLEHMNPLVRLHEAELAGLLNTTTAVGSLIRRVADPAETPEVKAAAQEALVVITGRKDLKDPAAWKKWWEAEGKTQFPPTAYTSEELLKQIAQNDDKNLSRITKAQSEVRSVAITLGVAILLFVFVMFFFVGHVSSKIKGWRELVSRAEVYIKHSQALTERTDGIAAELDAKKAEVSAFLDKLRKEHEEGIARRGDDLGTELAHQLRMELQTLRQKAERELGQTVTDLKTQIEASARRAASEVRDRLAK